MMPIHTFPIHSFVVVTEIRAPSLLKKKLSQLGLKPLREVMILQNDEKQPLLIKIENRRIAIRCDFYLQIFARLA